MLEGGQNCRRAEPSQRCYKLLHTVHQLYPPAAHVLGGTHTELFGAGYAQGLSRDAECRRDFSDQDMPLRLSFQQSLEAGDDVLVLTCGAGRLDRGTVRETFDNGFDQLLLQSMRGFPVDGCVRSAFDRRSIASIPAE